MLDLYLAELRRFRFGAVIFALAHLVILAEVQQHLELTSAGFDVHLLMLFLYMLTGLGFAVLQFGSYRRPSRWIWLQHRPLHRAHILAALVLATLTLVGLAVALPQAVVLAAQEHFTHRVIDARHYAGAACLALSTMTGWLCGGWIMLHPSRWAFLVLDLPVVLCLHLVTASTAITLWLVCNAILLLLLYTVFRPERNTAPNTLAVIPGALVLQLGFFKALLFVGTTLFLLVPGPQQAGAEEPNGYFEAMRMEVPNRLLAGLAASTEPHAGDWRAELSKDNTQTVNSIIRRFAISNLVSNWGQVTFAQGEDKWTFSQDQMMYRGLNTRTGADEGWFGAGGHGATGAFNTQPITLRDKRGDLWVVDGHTLYAADSAGRHLRNVFQAESGEWLASGIIRSGSESLLLTNRRLVLLEPAGGALAIKSALELPLPFGDLGTVDTARVADGTLISMLYKYRQTDVKGKSARQLVYLVTDAGVIREVGRRELAPDFPALWEQKHWWVSPPLQALVALPDVLTDNGDIPDAEASRWAPLLQRRPTTAWVAAIACMLLASASSAWWGRRACMAPKARVAWCLTCLLMGVPALLALVVLAPIPILKTTSWTRTASLTRNFNWSKSS